MKKFFLVCIVILIAATIFGYKYYVEALHYSLSPGGSARVIVDIPQGATAQEVGDLLYEKQLIESPLVFKLYLRQNNLSDNLSAGRLVLSAADPLPKLVDTLVSGKAQEMAVTLLEGWTAQQMGQYLEDAGLTTAADFMSCVKTCKFDFAFLPKGSAEGYLYPDTYFVDPSNFKSESLIRRMIGTLNKKLTDSDWKAMQNSGHTLAQIMIMASIVEREERSAKERPTVAGILWNRFDAGQGLYADATLLYALGRTKGGLSYADLDVDSPYNTRKYRGLPPGPISNPSIESIRAAISPAKTDYWYYLHDSDGQVHYARTLEEHNANKAKYIGN